jgi:hypothetical protein
VGKKKERNEMRRGIGSSMEAFGRRRRNRDDEERGGNPNGNGVGVWGGERKSNSLNSIFTPRSQSYKTKCAKKNLNTLTTILIIISDP